jgi:HEAT repeat protein
MKSPNVLTRANAIDKLGRMKSRTSTEKIIAQLGTGEPEIISVSVRALGKIGSTEALTALLKRLSVLAKKSLITRTTAETALIQFGEGAAPALIASGWEQDHPKIKAIILEALSRLGAEEALPLAIHNLQNVSPEVRAKALKVLSALTWNLEDFDGGYVMPLLTDDSWFVRLHATKVLGSLRYEKAAGVLGGLLFDENWQVRNGAATALGSIGGKGIDVFRTILAQEDRYAKESICEEIERTDLVTRLIGNLESADPGDYERSSELLWTMCSLNFRTQCEAYAEWGENEKIRAELNHILQETGAK